MRCIILVGIVKHSTCAASVNLLSAKHACCRTPIIETSPRVFQVTYAGVGKYLQCRAELERIILVADTEKERKGRNKT